MPSITPAQIRGACGMLDWSKLDLAKAARLSISVVMSAMGPDPGRVPSGAMAAMRSALEASGVEFTMDDDGVGLRLRNRQPSVFARFFWRRASRQTHQLKRMRHPGWMLA